MNANEALPLPVTLGIPVYDGVDLLDVTGPFEMFSWVGETKLKPVIASENGRAVASGNGVRFEAHATFADRPLPRVLWVPGGMPTALEQMMRQPDSQYFRYLKEVAEQALWVCSVCEGALLLGRAGLLDGHQATTHWRLCAVLRSSRLSKSHAATPASCDQAIG